MNSLTKFYYALLCNLVFVNTEGEGCKEEEEPTPCPGQGVENVRDDGGACEDLGQGLDIEMQSDPKLSDIQIESVFIAVKGGISNENTTE